MQRPLSVSPAVFKRIALAAVCCYALLVVTGGAVRLTGSGLGCPDWPTCTGTAVTPPLSFHPMVEFSNRVVTIAVSVVSIAALLGALLLRPRRRELTAPAAGLVAGLLAQVVLGGVVVLFKLNPYLVALHFLLTFGVLACAVVLLHRASAPATAPVPRVGPEVLWFSRLLIAALVLLVCLGTLVSGSGPHAGAPGTPRIPIAFRDIAEAHSSVALFLVGLVLAGLLLLHQARAPEAVQRRARTLLELLALQGALGYTQYFLHDNALVVEFHLAGATSVFLAAIAYLLALYVRPEVGEPDLAPLPTRGAAAPLGARVG